ncbi:MAG: hypothetical protein ACRCSG_09470 [Cellulosilyticaceae bacterium]
MKKQILIGIILISGILTLANRTNRLEEVVEVSNIPLETNYKMQNFYIPENVSAGHYENENGVYLGAYIEKNQDVENDMEMYEQIMGQDMAFRVFQYKETGDIGNRQILECIASNQVPYIKVLPNKYYDLMPIYEMIGDLNNRYETTVFIELFPVDSRVDDVEMYLEYYENAYKILKKYVQDCVIVWSVDTNTVYESSLYYPGNHLVDWIGLNVVVPSVNADISHDSLAEIPKEEIDFWYKTYQQEKPLMFSNVAVPHFSRVNHTYTIEDAKNKLTYFYDTALNMYPRIRAVLYTDIDMSQVSSNGKEDYRLTSQKKITDHMNKLLNQSRFLSEVEKNDALTIGQQILYTVPSYEINGNIYITEEQLEFVCKYKELISYIPCIMDDTEVKYYDLEQLVNDQLGIININ